MADEQTVLTALASVQDPELHRDIVSLNMVRDITVDIEPGQPEVLRLGMSVQIEVELAMLKQALAVPASALAYRSGLPGVVLKRGGWQSVLLGERSAEMFIIAGGLKEGDMVRL